MTIADSESTSVGGKITSSENGDTVSPKKRPKSDRTVMMACGLARSYDEVLSVSRR